jgi:alpha-galactosidase
MNRHKVFLIATLVALVCSCARLSAQNLAATPPMGWNSWDAYGLTINEEQFKANATVLAGVEQFGWQYAVIDEGWYMANPDGKNLAERKYLLNSSGIPIPAPARFPSAAGDAGFKPIADWVHHQGLKFGIHIVRGIPKDAVKANMPIAGSQFRATDAADTSSPCPWDDGNWGVKDNEAGQAFYDAQIKLFASWGVDFLKVDCISQNPYRPSEIRQIAMAIRKAGRPMLLSLSPGPTQLEHAAEVQKYAQMWRIADDHWDGWTLAHVKNGDFPFGIRDEFDRIAKWYTYTGPGSWPDPDMLPWGSLTPRPGYGEPRQSKETAEEQKTEFALWSISRAPLILGCNLTRLDPQTKSFLSNQNILFINQNVTYSRPLDSSTLGSGFDNIRVWRASINEPGERGYKEFYAFFNLGESATTVKTTWAALGLDAKKHSATSEWDDSEVKEGKEITVTLPAHGSQVFEVH